MNRYSLRNGVFLSLLFMVASCSDSRPVSSILPTILPTFSATKTILITDTITPVATATPRMSITPTSKISNFESPPNATPFKPDWKKDHDTYHSSDFHWQIYLTENQPISITSLLDGKILKDSVLGPYLGWGGWFPDNNGFIVFDADNGCERCPYDRINFFHIDTQSGILKRYVFEPLAERNKAFNFGIAWSPDGSQMAVIVGLKSIYIMDTKGTVIDIIKPTFRTDNTGIDQVEWTNQGLLFLARYYRTYYPPRPQSMYLYSIDLDHPESTQELLLSSLDYPYIVSASPFSPMLLLKQDDKTTCELGCGEFVTFNIQTKIVENVIIKHGGQYPYFSIENSKDRSVVAIQTNSDGDNLFFFYWKQQSLVPQHIRVDKIVEWRQDLQAFIVLRSDTASGKQWLETIKP